MAGGIILIVLFLYLFYRFHLSKNLQQCTVPVFKPNPCDLFESYNQKTCLNSFPSKEEIRNTVPDTLKNNVPENISLFNISIGHAGGDVLTRPLVAVENKILPDIYCLGSENNLEEIFSPLEKEEVIDYLNIRLIKLSGSSYQRTRSCIQSEREFNSVPCFTPEKEGIEPRYTKLKEAENGFLVDWVYFSFAGESGIYEQKIEVTKDAKIKLLGETQEIVFCGGGIMF